MADKICAKDTKMFKIVLKSKFNETNVNFELIKMYCGILQVIVEKFHNLTVVIVPSTNV